VTTPLHERYADTAVLVVCRDGADALARRAAASKEHLAYIEALLGELNLAGPLYDAAGLQPVGSLFVYRTTSLARARELIENDPFFKAGVFASVEYFPYLPAAGKYVGGKIW
jgi:uncharacterized protein